jgi:hypothetical protein
LNENASDVGNQRRRKHVFAQKMPPTAGDCVLPAPPKDESLHKRRRRKANNILQHLLDTTLTSNLVARKDDKEAEFILMQEMKEVVKFLFGMPLIKEILHQTGVAISEQPVTDALKAFLLNLNPLNEDGKRGVGRRPAEIMQAERILALALGHLSTSLQTEIGITVRTRRSVLKAKEALEDYRRERKEEKDDDQNGDIAAAADAGDSSDSEVEFQGTFVESQAAAAAAAIGRRANRLKTPAWKLKEATSNKNYQKMIMILTLLHANVRPKIDVSVLCEFLHSKGQEDPSANLHANLKECMLWEHCVGNRIFIYETKHELLKEFRANAEWMKRLREANPLFRRIKASMTLLLRAYPECARRPKQEQAVCKLHTLYNALVSAWTGAILVDKRYKGGDDSRCRRGNCAGCRKFHHDFKDITPKHRLAKMLNSICLCPQVKYECLFSEYDGGWWYYRGGCMGVGGERCAECGWGAIDEYLCDNDRSSSINVQIPHWDTQTREGKTQRQPTLNKRTGARRELIKEIEECREGGGYLKHKFNADYLNRYAKISSENPVFGKRIVMFADYAAQHDHENMQSTNCEQKFHSNIEVIHVFLRESKDGPVVSRSFRCMGAAKADTAWHCANVESIVNELKAEGLLVDDCEHHPGRITIEDITDRCAGQYANHRRYGWAMLYAKRTGHIVEIIFREPSHGKMICDAMGWHCKRALLKAAINGKAIFMNTFDMVLFLLETMATPASLNPANAQRAAKAHAPCVKYTWRFAREDSETIPPAYNAHTHGDLLVEFKSPAPAHKPPGLTKQFSSFYTPT